MSNAHTASSLSETYRAHGTTKASPYADIFDAAHEYYVAKYPIGCDEEEPDWMLRIEAKAHDAVDIFRWGEITRG